MLNFTSYVDILLKFAFSETRLVTIFWNGSIFHALFNITVLKSYVLSWPQTSNVPLINGGFLVDWMWSISGGPYV